MLITESKLDQTREHNTHLIAPAAALANPSLFWKLWERGYRSSFNQNCLGTPKIASQEIVCIYVDSDVGLYWLKNRKHNQKAYFLFVIKHL